MIEEMEMRSCRLGQACRRTQSKNCLCMLNGVRIIHGGMACTVSEAQLESQTTAFVSREENHCILHSISYYATLSDQA
jgi:hypothetical protein